MLQFKDLSFRLLSEHLYQYGRKGDYTMKERKFPSPLGASISIPNSVKGDYYVCKLFPSPLGASISILMVKKLLKKFFI